MAFELERFFGALVNTILWSLVSIAIVMVVFEVLEHRYRLRQEIFEENSTAAALFGGAFVLGIFYTVATIVTH